MSTLESNQHRTYNIFCNPFYIQSIVWSITFILYSQRWSLLYPPLTSELYSFLIITIILSFMFGYYCQWKRFFCFFPLKKNQIKKEKLKFAIRVLYFILTIEVIVTGFPMLSYIFGGNTKYTDFGLPVLHVIVVIGFTIVCLLSYYSYISTNDKMIRRVNMKYIIVSLIPFLLMFNRGALLTCISGMGMMYLMSCKNPLKKIFQMSILSLVILWGFGYLGDLRTDVRNNEHMILEIGQASEEFRKSSIPKEFFWAYLYFTSPLSNCQYTINYMEEPEISINNTGKLVLFSMVPEIISKRISEVYDIKEEGGLLITNALNVSPYINYGFIYLGWFGMVIMYLFSFFFVMVTISFVSKKSPYYVPIIVSINLIMIMNVFANMFIFMGLVPIPFFLLLMSRRYIINRQHKYSYPKLNVETHP